MKKTSILCITLLAVCICFNSCNLSTDRPGEGIARLGYWLSSIGEEIMYYTSDNTEDDSILIEEEIVFDDYSIAEDYLSEETSEYDAIEEIYEYEEVEEVEEVEEEITEFYVEDELAIAPPVPSEAVEEEEEVIFVVVESMPEFPGGQQAMMRYIGENIQYPVIAQENGIQGRVICQFVIEKDGKVTDIQVVRSSGDASLDKEAIRVINSMPKWTPGKQRGKTVRVKYTIPVNFRLQ
jgi:TonB family protein